LQESESFDLNEIIEEDSEPIIEEEDDDNNMKVNEIIEEPNQ